MARRVDACRVTEVRDRAPDLRLAGDIDSYALRKLRLDVNFAFRNNDDSDFVIDVSQATFFDSAGLAVLARACMHSSQVGHNAILQGASDELRRLLSIAGMDQMFVYDET